MYGTYLGMGADGPDHVVTRPRPGRRAAGNCPSNGRSGGRSRYGSHTVRASEPRHAAPAVHTQTGDFALSVLSGRNSPPLVSPTQPLALSNPLEPRRASNLGAWGLSWILVFGSTLLTASCPWCQAWSRVSVETMSASNQPLLARGPG